MDNDLLARVGTFFLILGAGAIILFVATGLAAEVDTQIRQNFDYLFFAVVLGGVGILLRRKATPPPPSGRFSALKNFADKSKKKEEPKKK